jgi:hypothetical protein
VEQFDEEDDFAEMMQQRKGEDYEQFKHRMGSQITMAIIAGKIRDSISGAPHR